MTRMRSRIAILIVWLFFFYNIERLSEPINITTMAYTLVPIVVVVTMLVPRLRGLPLWVLLVTPIPLFLVLKTWEGSRVWGTALPLTVTEICAIAVTTLLSRQVSSGVSEFENAVANLTMGPAGDPPEPFSAGQEELYREVRRARSHQRPLILMAIRVDENSVKVALDRMVQEAQQAMMKQYVLSSVSKTLCTELEDYNIIAKSRDDFLVLLPEATPTQLPDLIRRLQRMVADRVGVTLRIGAASLPDDAVTFEGLVEKAVKELKGESESFPSHPPATEPMLISVLVQEKVDELDHHQSA